MNNYHGNRFEVEFARLLFDNGFWVRQDKGSSQAVDLIAIKNNIGYIFECKVCQRDYFSKGRVEANQSDSIRMFRHKGNSNYYFVYKVDGNIYLSKEPLSKPSLGIKWEDWINENI